MHGDIQCHCQQHPEPIYLDYIPAPGEEHYYGATAYLLPFWVAQYLSDVRDGLKNSPRICGAVALTEKYMATAIEARRDCPGCNTFKELTKFLAFAHNLVQWIDEEIDQASSCSHAALYDFSNTVDRSSFRGMEV